MASSPSVQPAGCPLAALAPLADLVLEGGPGLPLGINDIIRSEAAEADHGARVAETFGLLGASQIRSDCVHPNDAGYATIAAAFISAFES